MFSMDELKFVIQYLNCYENTIKQLNKEGYFDQAKMFENFALKICNIWFNDEFVNLNSFKVNYPYVDLLSKKYHIYVQVSTNNDIPSKIKSTLENISKSEKEEFKNINKIYFFVLRSESINNVVSYKENKKIGNVEFDASTDIITTGNIIEKAHNNPDFLKAIYKMLNDDYETYNKFASKYRDALIASNAQIKLIRDKIGSDYEIDRIDYINNIMSSNSKFILVTGDSGVGKSVICKKVCANYGNNLFIRAESLLQVNNIYDLFSFSLSEFFEIFSGEMLIFIDSLEFIADVLRKRDLLTAILECCSKYEKIKIIASCRTTELNSFTAIIKNYHAEIIQVNPLEKKQITKLAIDMPIIETYSRSPRYSFLIENPFYLDILISKCGNCSNFLSEKEFRKYIFDEVICIKDRIKTLDLSSNEIYSTVLDIVTTRAKEFTIGVNINKYDKNIINALISSDVLVANQNTVRMKFDIFEDICFEILFDSFFDNCKGEYSTFFNCLDSYGRCCYRRYQIWLSNKLKSKCIKDKFIYKIVFEKNNLGEWRKQTLICIVKSNYCENFFCEFSNSFNEEIIKELIECTNLYAQRIELNYKFGNKEYVFLKPIGLGRNYLIRLIHKENLLTNIDVNSIVNLCVDYAESECKDAESSYSCVKILIKLFENLLDGNYYKNGIERVLGTIYKLSYFCKEWVEKLWEDIEKMYISNTNKNFAKKIFDFTIHPSNAILVKTCKKSLFKLCEIFWLEEPVKEKREFFYYDSKNDYNEGFYLNSNTANFKFGIDPLQSIFLYYSFIIDFKNTLTWVISFFNKLLNKSISKGISYQLTTLQTKYGEKQYYFANTFMSFGFVKHNSCKFISDIVYSLIKAIESLEKEAKLVNLEFMKDEIFKNSNNGLLFGVLAWAGISQFPQGNLYAIDLCSSIDVLNSDIHRYVLMNPPEEVNKMEESILYSLGVMNSENLYNVKSFKILRDYFIDAQIFNENSKEVVGKILGILSKKIDKSNEKFVESFDITSYDFIPQDSMVIMQSKNASVSVDPREKINIEINNVLSKIKSFGATMELYEELLSIYEKIEEDIKIFYQEIFVISLVGMLTINDISLNKREEITRYLLDFFAESVYDNRQITVDGIISKAIFNQLELLRDKKLIYDIKSFIIKIIVYGDNSNRLQNEIRKGISLYLDNENQLQYLNAISFIAINMAKEQKDIHKEKKKMDNYDIEQNIITSTLANEKLDWNYEKTNEKFDLKTLLKLFTVDFKINDPHVQFLFELTFNEIQRYNLINDKGYLFIHSFENYISSSFMRENDYFRKMFDLVFKCIKKEMFNEKNFNMYFKFFHPFCSLYFDSYENQLFRTEIINKISYIEQKIKEIGGNDKYKEGLIPYPGDYMKWDCWDKYKTDYKIYTEKMFLVRLFSDYGYLNIEKSCKGMYMMKYEKLMPEILVSMDKIINYYYKNKKNELGNSIRNNHFFYIHFISEAYVNNLKIIQDENEYFAAFKNILIVLVEFQVKEAALILEEILIN